MNRLAQKIPKHARPNRRYESSSLSGCVECRSTTGENEYAPTPTMAGRSRRQSSTGEKHQTTITTNTTYNDKFKNMPAAGTAPTARIQSASTSTKNGAGTA